MATDDSPMVGQLIDHRFLWVEEQAKGQVEGRKARPCLILAVEQDETDAPRVTVVPITSQRPREGTLAVPIPQGLLGDWALIRHDQRGLHWTMPMSSLGQDLMSCRSPTAVSCEVWLRLVSSIRFAKQYSRLGAKDGPAASNETERSNFYVVPLQNWLN